MPPTLDDQALTICDCLRPAVRDLIAAGAKVTYVGTPWSQNCRTWVYVDRVLDTDALRTKHTLPLTITPHTHLGTHEGSEHGLVCTQHKDAIMGPPPRT